MYPGRAAGSSGTDPRGPSGSTSPPPPPPERTYPPQQHPGHPAAGRAAFYNQAYDHAHTMYVPGGPPSSGSNHSTGSGNGGSRKRPHHHHSHRAGHHHQQGEQMIVIDYGTSSSPNRVPKLPPSSSSLSSKPPPPIPPSSSSSSSLAAAAAAGMKPSSHPVTVLQNARHFSNTEVTIAHSRVVQGPSHYRYQHQEQESQPAQYYHGQHQHGHGGRQQVAPQQQQRHHRHQYHLDQVDRAANVAMMQQQHLREQQAQYARIVDAAACAANPSDAQLAAMAAAQHHFYTSHQQQPATQPLQHHQHQQQHLRQKHHSPGQQHQHHHHHGGGGGNGGHHSHHHHHHGHGHHHSKPNNRSSHSSDTSSAYSGSDTMQSIHSSLENEAVVDLSGLHESVVDSDEDLADSLDSMAIREPVRECLEKDPADRTPEDIDILLEFTQTFPAFFNMTLATRRALCAVMVFAVVEKAGTIVMNDNEELDSWSVIINGEVRIDPSAGDQNGPKFLKWGDNFGITPTMEKLYHRGVMRTCQDDCQFVCITQTDYYKILNEGESNQRKVEDESGAVVLVTEPQSNAATGKFGHKVIRGTPDRLLSQLIDENAGSADPTYVEDYLLTHRIFVKSSLEVAEKLLEWCSGGQKTFDRVTRVLLLWVHNHFTDFEMDPEMMQFLERFETALEAKKMNGQLRMLNFACAEKARKRVVILTRPCREEPLRFSLMGGYERGFGIFVERVEAGSKASEVGLKRGDQIIEVNRQSFEHNKTLQWAVTFLKDCTHLEMVVKSNLLVFKEMLQTPENSPRSRLRKTADTSDGLKKSDGYDVNPRTQSPSTESSSLNDATSNASAPDGRMTSRNSASNLPSARMSRTGRFMGLMRPLLRGKSSSKMHLISAAAGDQDGSAVGSDQTDGKWEIPSDVPDHSLKIYKADQSYKYLLVHNYTSAREVVMLALQEFGISESSTNFTLTQVTVDGGFRKERRLHPDQKDLAEKIGLASRYYIKNIMNSEQLIADENELARESQVSLLQVDAVEVAMQLMVDDFKIFRMVEQTEYVDNLFGLESKFGNPNLVRFEALINTEQWWVITEIVSEPTAAKRARIVKQFIKVAYHCYKETQNFNSMFAITAGLDHGSVKRLRSTWEKVHSKYMKQFMEMNGVMDPTMNFRKYRHLIGNASSRPPLIPIYPMVNKDLTFIDLGNETRVDDMINFEKLRMLAKEVRSLTNMCSGSDFNDAARKSATNVPTMKRGSTTKGQTKAGLNPRKMYEESQMVRRVRAYLAKMPVIRDEEQLHKMSLEVEPPPQTAHTNIMPHATSSTSIKSGLSGQNSTASLGSNQQQSQSSSSSRPRGQSPTPSMGSTASSTSHQSQMSEGKKSTTSGAAPGTKFGTDSPQAVRKLMSLSEPGKTRMKPNKYSTSSLNSPPSSPTPPIGPSRRHIKSAKGGGHERSSSDSASKISLSAESSSVTSLPGLRKGAGAAVAAAEPAAPPPKKPATKSSLSSSSSSLPKIPKAKIGRTTSRDRIRKERRPDDDDDEAQVSAV